MKPTACPAHEALQMLVDRLDHFGHIDHIREEGPIADARVALDHPCHSPALAAALLDILGGPQFNDSHSPYWAFNEDQRNRAQAILSALEASHAR